MHVQVVSPKTAKTLQGSTSPSSPCFNPLRPRLRVVADGSDARKTAISMLAEAGVPFALFKIRAKVANTQSFLSREEPYMTESWKSYSVYSGK